MPNLEDFGGWGVGPELAVEAVSGSNRSSCGQRREEIPAIFGRDFIGGGFPSLDAWDTRPNFIHPHTPTPKHALLWVGGGRVKRGRAYKIPAVRGRGSKHTCPPPSPEKCLLAKRGEGGG